MPELGFGAHFFEKHQVNTLGYIDAGVHHIHRNGNVRLLLRPFKCINHILGIGILTNDALRKRAVIFGVQLVEPLQNEFRMAFGLGKDDGFADVVATGNLDATGHQILQNGIHGDFVKNEPV